MPTVVSADSIVFWRSMLDEESTGKREGYVVCSSSKLSSKAYSGDVSALAKSAKGEFSYEIGVDRLVKADDGGADISTGLNRSFGETVAVRSELMGTKDVPMWCKVVSMSESLAVKLSKKLPVSTPSNDMSKRALVSQVALLFDGDDGKLPGESTMVVSKRACSCEISPVL